MSVLIFVGKRYDITWTRLSATASVGATTITLQLPVEWEVGHTIVIATTGHRHSQIESETRVIAAVSGDKMILTFNEPLAYEHLGITQSFGSRSVDFRAEVMSITRNIVIRGNNNVQWNDDIPKCAKGFDTGMLQCYSFKYALHDIPCYSNKPSSSKMNDKQHETRHSFAQ